MNDWHLIVVTHGGTVSILKNLTKEVAQEAQKRLLSHLDVPCLIEPGTITTVHMLGPEDNQKGDV